MTETIYQLPFGKSTIEFKLPAGMQADIASSRQVQPVADPRQAVREALAHPIGVPPLRKMAKPGDWVCIAFTDSTRSTPDGLLVGEMLRELELAGVKDADITLLCATGMHRKATLAEKIAKLGEDIIQRYRVIDHEPQNSAALVDLGTTSSGVPVQVHRAVVEADLSIATGIVEPHQYAGYSGGGKTLVVGAAGEALIAFTHGPAFVDHPLTRLGRIDGNPFQEAVTEAMHKAGLGFIVNVVMNEDKQILCVRAGHPEQAFQELVAFARSIYETPIQHQYDLVIGGAGYPKDSNLYQASRAASYLFFAPTSVVRPGGSIIIPARCEEGAGNGVGEQRFLDAMSNMPDIQTILEDARRHGYPPGQQRAFVMAKVLEQVRVIIVGSETPEVVTACKMTPVATMDEAIQMALKDLGENCQVLIVPHALLTLPVIENKK